MQNREVSWLRFNERVLDEARMDEVPLLEKMKFISIFGSNLDEFFMVRVGSLHDLSQLKKIVRDNKTGMTPQEQIDTILKMLPAMYEKRDQLYADVTRKLNEYDIHRRFPEDLNKEQANVVKEFYRTKLDELISPQIIDAGHPFPFLENKKLYVVVELDQDGYRTFGLVPIRNSFPKYLMLPGDQTDYILTSDIVMSRVESMFEGFRVINKHLIAVTRNFDMSDDKDIRDEFDDFKEYMKVVLKKRQRLYAVRLESVGKLPKTVMDFLLNKLKLRKEQTFVSHTPLSLGFVFGLLEEFPSALRERLMYRPFPAYNPLPAGESMIAAIRKDDLLMSYPYDDIDAFIQLLKEASEDPECMSIKVTIYRLAKNSKVVKYLCRAAENGKEVTVFVELKARFDEENNINYSNVLYESGCNIIYGFSEYKTHSKLFLITFRDKDGEVRYITQIGTGNYNESTSRLYTDFSLITADKEIGLDANDFFKNMAVGNLNGKYEHLLQAPTSLKQGLIRLMDREIAKGPEGRIFCKFNSLTDKTFIEKFSEASRAGVEVRLIIRGICCLLPGIEGLTEHVEIHNVVGRFLEHSRVYIFGRGTDADVFISSADLMTRNTERRVEIAAPIYKPELKQRLEHYLEQQFRDNVKGRVMQNDGTYAFVGGKEENPFSSQDFFIQEAGEKVQEKETREKQRQVETGNAAATDQAVPERVSVWKRLVRTFKRK